jgi:hypothetical protein
MATERVLPDKDALIQAGRLLSQEEVLRMWPISREYLSRLTNHRDNAKRLPSYRYGKRPFYAFEELMFYRENQRYEPKRRGKK